MFPSAPLPASVPPGPKRLIADDSKNADAKRFNMGFPRIFAEGNRQVVILLNDKNPEAGAAMFFAAQLPGIDS